MSLRESIIQDQQKALKERQKEKLAILRVLSAAVKNAEIDKQEQLEDAEVQRVVASQVKQLSDALKDFVRAGRHDLIEKTNFEIECLKSYLPDQLEDNEVKEIIKKVVKDMNASGAQDLGKVMGAAMKELKGRADGERVRRIAVEILG